MARHLLHCFLASYIHSIHGIPKQLRSPLLKKVRVIRDDLAKGTTHEQMVVTHEKLHRLADKICAARLRWQLDLRLQATNDSRPR